MIRSLRRECLDHAIIWNERHLRRVLAACADYDNAIRTHLALGIDAPEPCGVACEGEVVAMPILG